jgi:hypothetical protein
MMANRTLLMGVSLCLIWTLGGEQRLSAQGGIPTGSTVIAEPADSALSQFTTFLKGHGDSAVSVDNHRHQIEARLKGVAEPVIFMFQARGDSTTVGAQGKSGGIQAMIMGMGTVNDWLKSRTQARPDHEHR